MYTFCGQEICGKGKIWGFTREKQLPVKQIGNCLGSAVFGTCVNYILWIIWNTRNNIQYNTLSSVYSLTSRNLVTDNSNAKWISHHSSKFISFSSVIWQSK